MAKEIFLLIQKLDKGFILNKNDKTQAIQELKTLQYMLHEEVESVLEHQMNNKNKRFVIKISSTEYNDSKD